MVKSDAFFTLALKEKLALQKQFLFLLGVARIFVILRSRRFRLFQNSNLIIRKKHVFPTD